MLLAQETKFALDITTEAEVLSYTYTGTAPRTVVARVDLTNIVGNGNYQGKIYLNDHQILPDFVIAVPIVSIITLQTRHLIIAASDILRITITGLTNGSSDDSDTSVDTTTYLMDVTPVLPEDIGSTISPDITEAIEAAIKNITVQVDTSRIILGPCSRPVVATPAIVAQSVVRPLLPKRCQ